MHNGLRSQHGVLDFAVEYEHDASLPASLPGHDASLPGMPAYLVTWSTVEFLCSQLHLPTCGVVWTTKEA